MHNLQPNLNACDLTLAIGLAIGVGINASDTSYYVEMETMG